MNTFTRVLEGIESQGCKNLIKHVMCLDNEIMDEVLIESLCSLYHVENETGTRAIAAALGVSWDCGIIDVSSKERRKNELFASFKGRFAIINGREDEGHGFIRFREELERKGLSFDTYWLDHLSIDTSTGLVRGFPLDVSYVAVLLVNPEPLESDSAPTYLLKREILKQLERQGYDVIPTVDADLLARSKVSTLVACVGAGVPVPRTLVTASIHHAYEAVKEMHAAGFDVVIKPVTKGGGWGVSKIPRGTPGPRVLDLLGKYKWWYGAGVILIQEFIQNSGHDTRVLVLDGLVLGAENRSAGLDGESWIYNISKGGKGCPGLLAPRDLVVVLDGFHATKQFFSGVDIIHDIEGNPYLLEVNSCPGFKGFEEHVGINVASFVINYIACFCWNGLSL